jgi:glycosyltransferase involved in cell wall biosynthesis
VSAPEVSIVIPAFNEQDAIAEEVAGVRRVMDATGRPYEVIVVDDGSSDRTGEIAAQLPVRLFRFPQNRGYGAALKRGIAEAHAPLVVITDADGTYPPEELPRLLAEAGNYDMVVGARTGVDVSVPQLRRPARWFLRTLAGFLAGRAIPDLNSGMRLMRREHVMSYAHILPAGFSFTTTITLALVCNDYRVGYVPINYRQRIGSSKIRPIDTYHFLILILRAIVLFNPLKVFLPMGAVLFVLGFCKFGFDMFWKQKISESAVIGFLSAILIWSFGLLADQNSRLGLERNAWGGNSPGDGPRGGGK